MLIVEQLARLMAVAKSKITRMDASLRSPESGDRLRIRDRPNSELNEGSIQCAGSLNQRHEDKESLVRWDGESR
jgi:hypothetical protein